MQTRAPKTGVLGPAVRSTAIMDIPAMTATPVRRMTRVCPQPVGERQKIAVMETSAHSTCATMDPAIMSAFLALYATTATRAHGPTHASVPPVEGYSKICAWMEIRAPQMRVSPRSAACICTTKNRVATASRVPSVMCAQRVAANRAHQSISCALTVIRVPQKDATSSKDVFHSLHRRRATMETRARRMISVSMLRAWVVRLLHAMTKTHARWIPVILRKDASIRRFLIVPKTLVTRSTAMIPSHALLTPAWLACVFTQKTTTRVKMTATRARSNSAIAWWDVCSNFRLEIPVTMETRARASRSASADCA